MANILLNRGGAGVSIAREETAQRLNPIIEALIRLNHGYDYVVERAADPEEAARLEAFQKIARVDVGKLAETILSAGGTPYNGIDLEPEQFALEADRAGMLGALAEQEQAFLDLVRAEADVKHHIRTEAILMNVRTNSEARLEFLRGGKQKR